MNTENSEERKFSHSSMSCYRRCRARYKWQYVDGYSPFSGLGQNRGSIGHAALGLWYTSGGDDTAALKLASDMYTEAEQTRNISLEDDWQLMQLILSRYFDWARENDNFKEIISIEQKFEIEIGGIKVIGYIDGVVQTKNSIWLLEHKFNKQVSTNHIDLDPQMTLYLLAAYKCGIEAKGILYNVIRVSAGGIAEREPVVRRQVFRNQEGLYIIEQELEMQLQEMQKFHETGGIVYRNPTKDCSWDCGFYDVCLSINDCGDAQSVLKNIPKIAYEEKKVKGEQDGEI